jgi:two-component system, OmpR family, alkaline phosphatase synthesis response regulator PhoP
MATPTPANQKTILIVDDQPFFITMQQNMLQRQGYRVFSASTGTEGLAQAKKLKPDIVLLDVEMPGVDGIEVCRQMKEDPELKHIPVIILTATQDPKLNERSFKAGAEITILKSVPGERLLNMLRLSLEKGRSSA